MIDHSRGGVARRDAALNLLAETRQAYVLAGQRTLVEAVLANGEASADDIRMVLELPPGIDPRCLGAVPKALAKLGIIQPVGVTNSRRPATHASHRTRWRLRDRDLAERWLADHPAPDLAEDAQRLLF